MDGDMNKGHATWFLGKISGKCDVFILPSSLTTYVTGHISLQESRWQMVLHRCFCTLNQTTDPPCPQIEL
jgi:hypothetical protein